MTGELRAGKMLQFSSIVGRRTEHDIMIMCGTRGGYLPRQRKTTDDFRLRTRRHARQTLVGRLAAERLVPLWRTVTSGVVKKGFAIEYRDLEPPRTGIFDGLEIVIDPDVDFEMQCFVLLHLFGHSVQWVAPSLAHKLDALQNTTDKERFLEVLHDYEHEAAGFGLACCTSWASATSTAGLAILWRPIGDMSSGITARTASRRGTSASQAAHRPFRR